MAFRSVKQKYRKVLKEKRKSQESAHQKKKKNTSLPEPL